MDGWNGGRRPLEDDAAEAARTAAYWDWLASAAVGDDAPVVAWAGLGWRWARLTTPAQADYEARHMRHSIGHSWDKYSSFGELYSLRGPDDLPEATVLVSGGRVVHAREHENARLSPPNAAALESLAARMGWEIVPEPTPFDVLRDDGSPNTRLRYLHRGRDGKAFGEAVFAGRLDAAQMEDLFRCLGGGFSPADAGLRDLRADPADDAPHEVLSVKFVAAPPTEATDAAGLHGRLCGRPAPGAR
jgi:hypothetical protein